MSDKNINDNTSDGTSILDTIPKELTELQKAVELCKQAATIGFDWPSIDPVFEKLNEEVAELKEAIEEGRQENIVDELGDVLFVCTNLARHLGVNPQQALNHANEKFAKRFKVVEKLANEKHPQQPLYDLETLDKIWGEVKILEKSNI